MFAISHTVLEILVFQMFDIESLREGTEYNIRWRIPTSIRIIYNAKWNTLTETIFLKSIILTVYSINKLRIYCFMYTCHYSLLPKFYKTCSKNSDKHGHYTRQFSNLHHNFHHTKIRAYSIVIRGITVKFITFSY